jgi:DNA ligase-associated metallophosphoesterase
MPEASFPGHGDMELSLAGSSLVLMPERAVYLPKHETLVAADLHLGKEGAFRAAGISTPDGPGLQTLAKLDQALSRSKARRLVFAGDLFHNKNALHSAARLFGEWRMENTHLQIALTPGGHDRWAGKLPGEWDVDDDEILRALPPFVVQHYPEPSSAGYVLSGHLHPGIVLSESRGVSLSLPCFHLGKDIAVLPAFGEFTGLAHVQRTPGDKVVAIVEGSLVAIP